MTSDEKTRLNLLDQLKNFRSHSTIFDINKSKMNMEKAEVIRKFKRKHEKVDAVLKQEAKERMSEQQNSEANEFDLLPIKKSKNETVKIEKFEDSDLAMAAAKKKVKEETQDLIHLGGTEDLKNEDTATISTLRDLDKSGLGSVMVNVDDDIMTKMLKKRAGMKEKIQKKWDGKKYVRVDAGNQKYMKSITGQKLKASFKNNHYEKWLKKKDRQMASLDEDQDGSSNQFGQIGGGLAPANARATLNIKKQKIDKTKLGFRRKNEGLNEVRNKQQIGKYHKIEQKKKEKELYNKKKHQQRMKNKGKKRK